ncbi:MAG: RagB/SusD family nutrient uptake outer membrane protein [Saprospiraceae bacterium]|nr:RagB/SusD family nutrient uptake outer membrane protein [Saprospiraceae bacterium]
MKNKNIAYLLFFAVFVFTSCEEFLNDPEPAQSLPSATAFTTARDIQTGLIGAYNAVSQSDLLGTNTSLCPDIMADNGEWRGSFPTYIDIFNIQVDALNGEIGGMWQQGFRAINHANLVLKALTTVKDPALTTELANRLEGEALFIRAAVYFEMVRFYGKPFGASSASDLGLPILTAPVEVSGDITFPARESVAAVYSQVVADFQRASTLLPERSERGRPNRTAAIGYLAEINFQQRNYPEAANLAGQVIAGSFALTAEPNGFFINEGSSEEIWAVIHTAQDNPGVNGSLATFHHVNGRGGDVVVAPDLVTNGFEKIVTDAQKAAIAAAGLTVEDLRFTTLTSQGNNIRNIEKYEDFTNNADDAPVLRLAEYYLMRAEALARQSGVTQESIDLLNAIRTRSLRVKDASGAVVANSNALVSFSTADFTMQRL